MKVEILIVSWLKDLEWLRYNLRSIQKFATGFDGVTLLVPNQEAYGFGRAALHDGLEGLPNFKIKFYERTPDTAKWHLDHQAQKCFADQHCPDADFILHTDSDCVFTEPLTPEDYFVDGKPVMLIEEFSRLAQNNNPWQAPTQKALQMDVKFETMRRHPQVNPADIYWELRNRVELVHGCKFRDYVLAQKPDFPWGFSEHCAIGAFALNSERWFEAYHWIDVAKDLRPKDKLIQFWSHSPIDQPQSTPFGLNLTPRAVYQRLGL